MPVTAWMNVEWLNANAHRAFPFAEDATRLDTTGTFRVPDSFLLALWFPVHAGLSILPERFFIRSITIFGSGYNVSIAYDDRSADPPIVATAVIARSSHVENNSYALPGTTNSLVDYDDTVGKVVVGRLAEIDELPPGRYFFDYEAGKLDQATIRPIIRGMSSLRVRNGNELSDRFFGDIVLVAGANISLTPIIVSGQDPQIRIDAISGEGLVEECECGTDDETSPPIRTINGIPPAPNGNFRFIGNDCMEIDPITNGLEFSDTCSKPCCGCVELEVVTASLERFGSAEVTLQNFVNRLETQVTQFSNVVLGTQLGDTGCTSV